MLWCPAYLAAGGIKPTIGTAMPTIASPVFGVDTALRTSLFSDTGGTTQAADNVGVARINDAFSVASISFQCDSAPSRPVIVPAAANGNAGLRFTQGGAAPKWMYAAGGSNPGALFQSKTFTMAVAYRRATALDWGGLFSAGDGDGGSGAQGYDLLLLEGNPAPEGYMKLVRGGGSDISIARPTGASYANNQVTKVVARSDPTNGMEIRSRSASGSFTGTAALPTTADVFTWNWALLGAELGYNGQSLPLYPFDGDIFELRFWNTRATDAQMTQMQTYLDAKFGA